MQQNSCHNLRRSPRLNNNNPAPELADNLLFCSESWSLESNSEIHLVDLNNSDNNIRLLVNNNNNNIVRMADVVEQKVEVPVRSALIGVLQDFNGTSKAGSPDDFIKRAERFARINRLDENEKLENALFALKGSAEKWVFDAEDANKDYVKDWNRFKEEFVKKFTNPGNDTYNFQLFNSCTQEKDESVEDYAERLKSFARLIKNKEMVPNVLQVNKFINGLSSYIKYDMKKKEQPSTMEGAINAAKILESVAKEKREEESSKDKSNQQKQNKQQGQQNGNNDNRQRSHYDHSNSAPSADQGKAKGNNGGGGGKPRDYSGIQCYNCQEYGHYSTKCSNPKKDRVVGPADKNKQAPAAAASPVKQEKALQGMVEERKDEAVNSRSRSSTPRYEIRAFIGNVKVTAHLDSGADFTCIDKKMFDNLNNVQEEKFTMTRVESGVQLCGPGDEVLKTIGEVMMNISVRDGGQMKLMVFVVEQLVSSILLGRDWIDAFVEDIKVQDSSLVMKGGEVVKMTRLNVSENGEWKRKTAWVRPQRAVTIPPHSAKEISVAYEGDDFKDGQGELIFEPTQRKKGLIGRVLLKCSQKGLFTTNVMNFSNDPVHLPAKYVIGHLHESGGVLAEFPVNVGGGRLSASNLQC